MRRRKRGHKQRSKSRHVSRNLVAFLLVVVAVATLFQFAPIATAHYPVPIKLALAGWCDPWPVCRSSTTPNPISSSSTAGFSSSSSQGVHVEDAWQQWTVTYLDGSKQQYRSDYPQMITQNFQLAQSSSEPSILDLTVPVQLSTSSLPSYSGFDASWKTVINNIPTVSVWVNNRPVGAVSQDLLSPIAFATGDQVGSVKYWNVRIIFLGGSTYCAATSNPCLDLSGSLGGLQSALIQIGVTIISSSYRSYSYTASPLYCNGQWTIIGLSSGPLECLVGSSTVAVPYGVNFNWSPSDTGTASLTLATAALTQCQTQYCFVWTQTGTQTVTLWSTVPVTIAGPPTTVTQAGPPIPTIGNTGPSNPSPSVCQIGGGKLWTLPDWVCGNTFGVNNVVWVLIIFFAFIILLYLATRRRR